MFSKLDLGFGDEQVRVKGENVHMKTFRERYGSYDVVVVSFGFTNTPATSIFLVNNVFSKYLDKFVLFFLDGILIYSNNEEEHVEHVRLTLKLLRKNKLYVGLSNYDFYEDRIHHLGHIILDRRIFVDPEKIEAMMIWPAPRNLTGVRYFLGLGGYCRKITKEYFAGKLSLRMGRGSLDVNY